MAHPFNSLPDLKDIFLAGSLLMYFYFYVHTGKPFRLFETYHSKLKNFIDYAEEQFVYVNEQFVYFTNKFSEVKSDISVVIDDVEGLSSRIRVLESHLSNVAKHEVEIMEENMNKFSKLEESTWNRKNKEKYSSLLKETQRRGSLYKKFQSGEPDGTEKLT